MRLFETFKLKSFLITKWQISPLFRILQLVKCLPFFYEKLVHCIMQFESFHWLSHYGLWAIIPCSTNMASVRVMFLSVFIFVLVFIFLYFGGDFNETIIPLALVGYETIIANSTISYPTRARGIIVKYTWLPKKVSLTGKSLPVQTIIGSTPLTGYNELVSHPAEQSGRNTEHDHVSPVSR